MAFLFGAAKGAEIIKRKQKKRSARNSIISAPGTTSQMNNDSLTIEHDWWGGDGGSYAIASAVEPSNDEEQQRIQQRHSIESLGAEPTSSDSQIAVVEQVAEIDEITKVVEQAEQPEPVKRRRPPRVPQAPAGSFSAAELHRTRSRQSDDGRKETGVPLVRSGRVRSSPAAISTSSNSGSYFEQLQGTNSRTNMDLTDSDDASSGEKQRVRSKASAKNEHVTGGRPVTSGKTPSRGSFAEALSQNRAKPRANMPPVGSGSSTTSTTAAPLSRLNREKQAPPVVGSFLETTATRTKKSGETSRGASWQEFISSVEDDHKGPSKHIR